MDIALVGGTGKEGRGLAVRWAKAGHNVRIGSRDGERGKSKGVELSEAHSVTIEGGDNAWAVAFAEVVLLSVPYSAHRATVEGLAGALVGKLVIDITVPLRPPKVRRVHLPEGRSAALETKAILGEDARVVAALHHVSSVHLAEDHPIDCDVLVCGDKRADREIVVKLIEDLGLPAYEAGPLDNAVALESLTPVLLFLNKHYDSAGTGIRITGLPRK